MDQTTVRLCFILSTLIANAHYTSYVVVPLNSHATSIGPGTLEYGQKATFQLYSSQPVTLTYVTTTLSRSTGTPIGPLYSEPFDSIHRIQFEYTYPYFDYPETYSDARLELSVKRINQTSNEDQGDMKLYHAFTIKDHRQIILIETNKPQFDHNDTLLFSVIILRPTQWTISGTTKPFDEQLNMSITITDSNSNTVHQWEQISETQAKLLSFKIDPTAVYGKWTITVQTPVAHGSTSILIRDHTDSVPNIRFQPPKWFHTKLNQPRELDSFLQLDVCVNQTDGSPGHGQVKLQLCHCSISNTRTTGETILDVNTSTIIMTAQSCPPNTTTNYIPRPCVVAFSELNASGCTSEPMPLLPLEPPKSGELLACVQLHDSPTSKSYSMCEKVETRFIRGHINNDHPFRYYAPFFKYGLPTIGQLRSLREYTRRTRVWLDMREVPIVCSLLPNSTNINPTNITRSIENPPFRIRPTITLDAFSSGKLTLPAIQLRHSAISLQVESQNPPFTTSYRNHLTGDKLRPAYSSSKQAIQLWPQQYGQPVEAYCDRPVSLTLIGNTRLLHKRLFIYGYARGTMFPLDELDNEDVGQQHRQTDAQCQDEDGPLGHYRCLPGDEDGDDDLIECLPGWQGAGCLQPVCHEKCHRLTGFCTQPGQCDCRQDWHGACCDQCQMCQCDTCWTEHYVLHNWTCPTFSPAKIFSDQILTNKQEMHETQTEFHKTVRSYRSIFKRTVNVVVKPNVYGILRFVIFYINKQDNENIELVSAHGQLWRHAVCVNDHPREGIVLSTTSTPPLPGDRVTLTVLPDRQVLPTLNTICHVRVWDERLMFVQTQRNLLSTESFNRPFEIDPDRSLRPALFPSSAVDLWFSGLYQAYHTARSYAPDLRDCSIDYELEPVEREPINTQPWTIESLLYKVDTPRMIVYDSNRTEWGLQYTFRLPSGYDSGRYWRASAFCYGANHSDGLWSSTSERLNMQSSIDMTVNTVARIKLLEIAKLLVKVNLSRVSSSQPHCVRLIVQLYVHEHTISLTGPQLFSKCVCDPGEHTFISSFQADLPGDAKLHVKLYVSESRTSMCSDVPATRKTNSFPKLIRTHSRTIHVILGENRRSSTSVLQCFRLDNPEILHTQTMDIPLTQLPKSAKVAAVQTYVSYTHNLVTPLLHNFEYLSERQVTSAYRHIALISTGISLFNYLQARYDSASARIHKLMVVLQRHLSRQYSDLFKYVKNYRPTDPSNSDQGIEATHEIFHTFDLNFHLAVHTTLQRAYAMKSEWLSLQLLYHAQHYLNHRLFVLFNYTQPTIECLGRHNNCISETELSFIAARYIAINEIPMDKRNWPYQLHGFRDVEYRLAECLLRMLNRVINMKRMPIEQFRTSSLANLAHALAIIFPKIDLLPPIMQLLHNRTQTTGGQDGTEYHEMHWQTEELERDGSTTSAAQITYHVYMALIMTGEQLYNLVPIIRWVVNKQNMYGEPDTSQDLLWGSRILVDFQERLEQLGEQTRLEHWIDVHLQTSFGEMRTLPSLRYNRIHGHMLLMNQTVESENVRLTFRFHSIAGWQCLLGRTGREFLDTTDRSDLKDRSLQPNEMTWEQRVGNRSGTILRVCLNPREKPIRLVVGGQTGWKLRRDSNWNAVIRPKNHWQIDSFNMTEHDLLIIVFKEYSDGQSVGQRHCVDIYYDQIACMQLAQPMTFDTTLMEQTDSEQKPVTYTLSECNVNARENCSESFNRVLTKPRIPACQTVDKTELSVSNITKNVSTVEALCNQTLFLARLVKNNTHLELNQIDQHGSVTRWISHEMDQRLMDCFGSEDQILILGLPLDTTTTSYPNQTESIEQLNWITLTEDDYKLLALTQNYPTACTNLNVFWTTALAPVT